MKIMTEATTANSSNYEELNDIQSKLLNYIKENPGIRYRELLRLTGLINGVLTYHISSLEKSIQIRVDRNNNSRTTRYYANDIPIEQSKIIGYVRIDATRQIILFILEHNHPCTFNEIVEHTKKSPSTVSWHLKRLKDAGIVSVRYGHQNQQLYTATDEGLVAEVLYKYKESFVDKVVNNYTQIIEEL
jgi:predicted transcriptional regulator